MMSSNNDRKFVVYCHTNKTNGKSYVGWTSKTIEERWHGHVVSARRGSKYYFHRAILKYGIDDWDHKILEVVDTSEEAKISEIKWIRSLKSRIDESGYNGTSGGDGTCNPPADVRDRLSKALTGIKRSKETREKMSASALARSKEHNEKVRESFLKWAHAHPEHYEKVISVKRKPVFQMTQDGQVIEKFSSVCEAAKKLGFVPGCISAVARGERQHHKGFVWRYELPEENTNDRQESR